MAPQGLICPKMEKSGDISVKKCDFIEVYPRFLVHSTKNLYKEKTGTRVEIWGRIRRVFIKGVFVTSLCFPWLWLQDIWTYRLFPQISHTQCSYRSFALYFPKRRAIQFFFFSLPFTDVFLFGSTFRFTFLLALGEGTNGRVVKAGTRITGGTGGVRWRRIPNESCGEELSLPSPCPSGGLKGTDR